MPELPEVETTVRGIRPHIETYTITGLTVRNPNLRWPVPSDLGLTLTGLKITQLERRGKYILFHTHLGTLILHLGMSGNCRILTKPTPPKKHDHIDITFNNNVILRFCDPRRFGTCLWTAGNPYDHVLLKKLGIEPLNPAFTGKYVWHLAQKRKVSIKTFIMNSNIVVGVGNIYAAEALFAAGINPNLSAGKVSLKKFDLLVLHIKKILAKSIEKGGTTLKDFIDSKGKPGYFSQHLKVYGRAGLPCVKCKTKLKQFKLGQRSTVFCGKCQK